jgi:hypothetical protein
MLSMYQDQPNVLGDLQDLFQFYRRELPLNMEGIKRAFADAGLCLNFIFMNKESQAVFGATMREQSEDVFRVFTAIAKATGGLSETAQNPAASFHAASQATAGTISCITLPTIRPRMGRSGRSRSAPRAKD